MTALRVIFAGTPEFSVHALKAIHQVDHEICAVYTQPDRPAGRGRKLTPSPVKQYALDNGMEVYQPVSLRDADAQKALIELNADIMVVVAYGLILPTEVLTAPKHGCLNIHASILPRWRGAAPIQRAIESGDEESGVTIMQMDEGLDTGDMLIWESTPINNETTGEQLHDTLAEIGGRLIVDALELVVSGMLTPKPQPEIGVTYAHKLKKAESVIDWNQSATAILRKINAFNPWPVAQTTWNGQTLRVWEAELGSKRCIVEPGHVISATKEGIVVATDDGELVLKKLQMPGKKPLTVAEILNANKIEKDDILGEKPKAG